MGNNRSRIAPTRSAHIVDSQSRARYQNQRELIQLRRKINNINIEHHEEMSRLNSKRYDVKLKGQQLEYEKQRGELLKRMDTANQQNSSLFTNESELLDENSASKLECPSLLLHNLNAVNEWEKSIIIPSNQFDVPKQRKSFKGFDTSRPVWASNFDVSHNSFEQSESFLLSDSLSLKQHTNRMKKAIEIAIARSKRDSKVITRRDAHNY